MPTDPDGARSQVQAGADLLGAQSLRIAQQKNLAVPGAESLEGVTNHPTAFVRDQVSERVDVRILLVHVLQAREGPGLPPFGAAVLHAHVPRGLEQKTRQRLSVLNAAVPQGLESPAQDLLRDVLRQGSVAHAAGGEVPQPVAISESQVLGELFGGELEQAIVG